jgi:hypothetical protein
MKAKMSKPSRVGLTRVFLGTMKAMRGQCEAAMNVPLLVYTYASQDDWIAFAHHCARTEPGLLLLLLLTEAGQGVACVAARCSRVTYMRVMRCVICEEACEACMQCEGFGNKHNERDNTHAMQSLTEAGWSADE